MITYIPVLPVWMIDNDEMALSLTVSGDHTLPTSGHVWLYGPQVQKLPIYLEMCVCVCVCANKACADYADRLAASKWIIG